MSKVIVSFYKEREGLSENRVFMRIENLDETAIELFTLPESARNARLVEIMREHGAIIQIDRSVAEGQCEELFPKREIYERMEKRAEHVKDLLSENARVAKICENTYRIISERMGEVLNTGEVTEKEIFGWYPNLKITLEATEEAIDQAIAEKDYDKVEDLCGSLIKYYNKVLYDVSLKMIKIKRIGDDLGHLLQGVQTQKQTPQKSQEPIVAKAKPPVPQEQSSGHQVEDVAWFMDNLDVSIPLQQTDQVRESSLLDGLEMLGIPQLQKQVVDDGDILGLMG